MGLLAEYGYNGFFAAQAQDAPGMLPARVTAAHKDRYEIITDRGAGAATLKSSAYYSCSPEVFPTTGDFVMITDNPHGDGLITRTLNRTSCFVRRDPYAGELTVAANFELVLILTSLNQELNINRLERYLAASWQSRGTPVVVLTKADLVPDYRDTLARVTGVALGADVIALSAHTGLGMERMSHYLKPGKTAVLLGSSGVGKSSLVNALAGRELMRVSDIRGDDAKGRHTTTHRQMLRLPTGALVIDTPGVRALGLYDANEGLEHTFEDIAALERMCRFTNCTHTTEPGCAVLAAIAEGDITKTRWDNYGKLKKEARFAQRKARLAAMKRAKEASQKQARHDRRNIDLSEQ